jgi:hypothetical protein
MNTHIAGSIIGEQRNHHAIENPACSISESDDAPSGAVVPPRYGRPRTFVQVVDHDLCHDFDGGDRAGEANLPGHKETDDECIDAGKNSPAYSFGK